MTSNQTFALKFIGRVDRKENEKINIFVRITVGGKRAEISVVKSVAKDSWNSSKERLNSKYKDFREGNAYIDQVRSKLTSIYRELSLKGEFISPLVIKNCFIGITDTGKTLIELLDYHNESQKNILKPGTLKNYFTTQKYVHKYLKECKKIDDIRLGEINYQFITEFEAYLRSYKPIDHHKALSNNGVMKKVNGYGRFHWVGIDRFF